VESLAAWFDREFFGTGSAGPVAAVVIGSGGKTSLIWHLARYFAPKSRSVLVATTTKMFPPKKTELLPGIDMAGRFNQKTGKLEALPLEELAERIPAYDLVLIEGDGSRGLPLKGWAEYEPVIPSFATVTIGVLPLWPLGKPISAEFIHRLPLFCALTGADIGSMLEIEHLVKVIAGGKMEKSLFSAAVGRKILFFNQIEHEAAVLQAAKLAALLPMDFKSRLQGIIAGSVEQDHLV
jgi:probable selenium-dependent hydroxylase accessory protein YqeC